MIELPPGSFKTLDYRVPVIHDGVVVGRAKVAIDTGDPQTLLRDDEVAIDVEIDDVRLKNFLSTHIIDEVSVSFMGREATPESVTLIDKTWPGHR